MAFADRVTAADVRAALLDWMQRSGWDAAEVIGGMRIVSLSYTPSVRRLQHFVNGGDLSMQFCRDVNKFITDYPEPGRSEDFRDTVREMALRRIEERERAVEQRRIALERARRDHVRKHLQRERERPRRTQPGILFGLDRDTIRALQGFA